MKTRWRKLFSLLLALTTLTGLMPGISRAVQAAGSSKALQPADGSAANVEGERKSNIYFGNYLQSSDGKDGFVNEPIKWQVLENGEGQLFLIADMGLDRALYHEDLEDVTWETSTIRSWLNGYGASANSGKDSGISFSRDNFIGAAFSGKERAAIASSPVANDDNPTYGTEGGNNTTDKIFLLSLEETLHYFGLTKNSDERSAWLYASGDQVCAKPTDYAVSRGAQKYVWDAEYPYEEYRKYDGNCVWWLRSPGNSGQYAAIVSRIGRVFSDGDDVCNGDIIAVRPALRINLQSILFTSAAAGGKSSDGSLGKLFEVPNTSATDWKLTIVDEDRSGFSAAGVKNGNLVTVKYSGAIAGNKEYISAIIKNSAGAVTHYGRVAQAKTASGSVTINVSGKMNGDDTLYVFNEQYNGDYQTDLASELRIIDMEAPGYEAGDIDGNGKVNIIDVIRLLKKLMGEAGETASNTDVNGDGSVNFFDVLCLLKKVISEAVEIH